MPFISDLDENYPDGDVHNGAVLDNDLRDTKTAILDTFPNVTGAVTPDHFYINRVSGVNTNIQDQLNNEDDGFTALSDEPYIISGTFNGQIIVGPYGYPAMRDTWGAAQSEPGVIQVVHNMDILLGLGATDYVPLVTTQYGIGVTTVPVVGVNAAAGSFTVHQHDNDDDIPVTFPFYFQIVLNL